MPDHDLVVRGGTVVDGTGAPGRVADVAVDGGRITAVGEVAGRGAEEIDADGLLVTPGWVDIHTHYDGQVTWDPLLTPSLVARRHHRRHGQLRRRLRAGPARQARVADRADGGRRGHPRHRAARGHHLGLGELPRVPRRARPRRGTRSTSARRFRTRRCAATSWATAAPTTTRCRPPTRSRRWAGSPPRRSRPARSGFTTSRTVAHRSADGRHTPSLTSTADELLGIARAIGATGQGVFEAVADLVDLDREFELIRAMAEVERPAALAHDAAATRVRARRVPPDPRAHRGRGRRRRRDARTGRGPPGRAHHAPRRPRPPAAHVADVPVARGAAAARARRRAPPARGAREGPRRARRARRPTSSGGSAPPSSSANPPRYDQRPDGVARPRRAPTTCCSTTAAPARSTYRS